MQTTRLGRTNLTVSVAGLGCGGPSRLGLRDGYGGTEQDAVRLVRDAIDSGITLIDTASSYGTESVVGRAVRESGCRDRLVITSKAGVNKTPQAFADAIDKSLHRLGLDCIDAYHMHGVSRGELPRAIEDLVPVLHNAQAAGKIRFLAISEQFEHDPSHLMFRDLFGNATSAAIFDVIMVGFNLLNPSARRHVFPHTQRHDVGTLCMFSVRRALSNPRRRGEVLHEMDLPPDALDFLGDDGSITQKSYRFCRHEPGVDCVLFGTGNTDHLRANVAAISGNPLGGDETAKLSQIFGDCESVSGS